MRKFFILAIIAIMCVACGNRELNEVCNMYEEVSSIKDENKKDANFKIFNDHFQKGKGQTK